MQLTLVSHYGPKPAVFAKLITQLQRLLVSSLGDSFTGYALEQVHGTIVGLEGTRTAEGVCHENFRSRCGEARVIDFRALVDFARRRFPAFDVRVGGFSENADEGFVSQGRTPFIRSFSIQGQITVAMGWPWQRGGHTSLLDDVRREMQHFGVLHKWHRWPADVDNDFFFVLGRVSEDVSVEQRHSAECELRLHMSQSPPTFVTVDRGSLSFVAYDDTQLPENSSRAFKVTASATTAKLIESIYD